MDRKQQVRGDLTQFNVHLLVTAQILSSVPSWLSTQDLLDSVLSPLRPLLAQSVTLPSDESFLILSRGGSDHSALEMWASQIVFSAWLLLFALHADAFGIIGHQLIADLASNFLTANASSQIESILDGRPLSSIAAWADSIKWMPQYRFTSKLHYINFEDDNPPAQCRFHWQAPGSQEVIAAIHNYTDLLMHAEEGSWSQSESLRFLTHYLEDSHQPLHCPSTLRYTEDKLID